VEQAKEEAARNEQQMLAYTVHDELAFAGDSDLINNPTTLVCSLPSSHAVHFPHKI
jgi:hypothetical protein